MKKEIGERLHLLAISLNRSNHPKWGARRGSNRSAVAAGHETKRRYEALQLIS